MQLERRPPGHIIWNTIGPMAKNMAPITCQQLDVRACMNVCWLFPPPTLQNIVMGTSSPTLDLCVRRLAWFIRRARISSSASWKMPRFLALVRLNVKEVDTPLKRWWPNTHRLPAGTIPWCVAMQPSKADGPASPPARPASQPASQPAQPPSQPAQPSSQPARQPSPSQPSQPASPRATQPDQPARQPSQKTSQPAKRAGQLLEKVALPTSGPIFNKRKAT